MQTDRLKIAMFTVLGGLALTESVGAVRMVEYGTPTDKKVLANIPPLSPNENVRLGLGAGIAVAGLVLGSLAKDQDGPLQDRA